MFFHSFNIVRQLLLGCNGNLSDKYSFLSAANTKDNPKERMWYFGLCISYPGTVLLLYVRYLPHSRQVWPHDGRGIGTGKPIRISPASAGELLEYTVFFAVFNGYPRLFSRNTEHLSVFCLHLEHKKHVHLLKTNIHVFPILFPSPKIPGCRFHPLRALHLSGFYIPGCTY